MIAALAALLLSLQLAPSMNVRRATSRRLLLRMHKAPDEEVAELLAGTRWPVTAWSEQTSAWW